MTRIIMKTGRDTRDSQAEERPCEDGVRRQSSKRQEESHMRDIKSVNTLILTSTLQNCEKIYFCV